MKISYLALAALCGCALQASPAEAQALRQPVSVRPAALSNDGTYYARPYYDDQEEPSPSDAAAEPQQAEPAMETPAVHEPVAQVSNPCDACCVAKGSCACDTCYLFGPAEAFKVFPGDNRWGINAGFWTQVGYHTEGTNQYGDLLMNDYPNHVQLHQQWFFLEKAVDTGGCGFDWGFRADYVYGTDGPDTQAFGNPPDTWDFGWNYGGAYGSAIPQLYAELGFNNLKAKIGHFYTIEGYEVIPATQNFFYSHAFEFYISEPFTHTGVLLEQKVTDDITILGGWTAGWDTGFQANGGTDFLGGVRLQLTEKLAFNYVTSIGDAGYDFNQQPGSDPNGYMHTVLFNWQINDRWNYVFQSNFVDNDLMVRTSQDTMSLNNYLFYRLNECWAVGTRFEWFKDGRLSTGRYQGTAAEVIDLTVGLNYRPAANVVVRPELRWDDFESSSLLQDNFVFGVDTVITY